MQTQRRERSYLLVVSGQDFGIWTCLNLTLAAHWLPELYNFLASQWLKRCKGEAMVKSWPVQLLRLMSGSEGLQQ